MKNEDQDKLMVRYLLGELPEPDRLALEEQCFAGGEAFDRMWEHENRLVDDYVRGRLAPAERERLESHYLASPVHRRRVATARNLLGSEAVPARSLPREVRPSLLQRLRDWSHLSPAWQMAMAAGMLLLIAGGGWLLRERARLQGQLAGLQTENAARLARERELADQIAAGQTERERLAAELEALRKQKAGARPVQSPAPQSGLTIFAFALSSLTREAPQQPLVVGPDADQVQLRVPLPPGKWSNLQASIKPVGGAPLWSQQQLKPRAGKVIVTVPAAKLPFNDYILTLSGADGERKAEEIRSYSFRVIRE